MIGTSAGHTTDCKYHITFMCSALCHYVLHRIWGHPRLLSTSVGDRQQLQWRLKMLVSSCQYLELAASDPPVQSNKTRCFSKLFQMASERRCHYTGCCLVTHTHTYTPGGGAWKTEEDTTQKFLRLLVQIICDMFTNWVPRPSVVWTKSSWLQTCQYLPRSNIADECHL